MSCNCLTVSYLGKNDSLEVWVYLIHNQNNKNNTVGCGVTVRDNGYISCKKSLKIHGQESFGA